MTLNPAEVVAVWPALAPLVALDNPPWRLFTRETGQLVGTRVCPSHVEALCVTHAGSVGAVRRPVQRWMGPPVPAMEFTGPVDQAVALLLAAPESRSEQQLCASCQAGNHDIETNSWRSDFMRLVRRRCVCEECECGYARARIKEPTFDNRHYDRYAPRKRKKGRISHGHVH